MERRRENVQSLKLRMVEGANEKTQDSYPDEQFGKKSFIK